MEESDDNEKMSEEESDIDDEDNEKKVEQTWLDIHKKCVLITSIW